MAIGQASWAGGSANLSLGPCKVEFSTDINTAYNLAVYTDLGGTDSLEFMTTTKKVDLKESQSGDRAADKIIVAQDAMLKFGATRGFAERLALIWQGFVNVVDSSGYVTQVKMAKRLAQRDSELFMWARITEYAAGKPSTNPRRVLYFKVAPAADSVSLKYDATTQRNIALQMEAYEETSVTDANGNPCYWWSGIATGANRL